MSEDFLLLDPFQNIVNVKWTPVVAGIYYRYFGGFGSFNLPGGVGTIQYIAGSNCFASGFSTRAFWILDAKSTPGSSGQPLPPGYVVGGPQPPPPASTIFPDWQILGAHYKEKDYSSQAGTVWTFTQKGSSCSGSVAIEGFIIKEGGSIGYWGTPAQSVGEAGGLHAGGWVDCNAPNDPYSATSMSCAGITLTVDGTPWVADATTIQLFTQPRPTVLMGTSFKP